MSIITDKIITFITENPVNHITAASIIYKVIEDIPTIQKEELLEMMNKAIQTVKNTIDVNSILFKKLRNIPKQVNY